MSLDAHRALHHSDAMPPDELLTSPQAAALLGKSHRTIHRLAESGGIPVAQKLPGPNGAYLFKRSDVEALLAPTERAAS